MIISTIDVILLPVLLGTTAAAVLNSIVFLTKPTATPPPVAAVQMQMSIDTLDVTDVVGNVFLRVQNSRRNCLLTFDGHVTRPVFFEETEGGPMEVSGVSIGLTLDPMALKLPGGMLEYLILLLQ